MPGEHLDLTSDPKPPAEPRGKVERRFLGVHFACCDVYNRIYLNSDGTAYQGYCPKCSKRVIVHIGPGGSDSRFFTAY